MQPGLVTLILRDPFASASDPRPFRAYMFFSIDVRVGEPESVSTRTGSLLEGLYLMSLSVSKSEQKRHEGELVKRTLGMLSVAKLYISIKDTHCALRAVARGYLANVLLMERWIVRHSSCARQFGRLIEPTRRTF